MSSFKVFFFSLLFLLSLLLFRIYILCLLYILLIIRRKRYDMRYEKKANIIAMCSVKRKCIVIGWQREEQPVPLTVITTTKLNDIYIQIYYTERGMKKAMSNKQTTEHKKKKNWKKKPDERTNSRQPTRKRRKKWRIERKIEREKRTNKRRQLLCIMCKARKTIRDFKRVKR